MTAYYQDSTFSHMQMRRFERTKLIARLPFLQTKSVTSSAQTKSKLTLSKRWRIKYTRNLLILNIPLDNNWKKKLKFTPVIFFWRKYINKEDDGPNNRQWMQTKHLASHTALFKVHGNYSTLKNIYKKKKKI